MKNWKLVVGAFGTIYFAKLLKRPGVMSETHRYLIPESDFLFAIEAYVKSRTTKEEKTMNITTESGKLIMTITLAENPDR